MIQHSDACERNKSPIAERLSHYIQPRDRVLELGSGTGQHITYFAKCMPESEWYPSDLSAQLPHIQARLAQDSLSNIQAPCAIDVSRPDWFEQKFDVIYTANTLHIISQSAVIAMFDGIEKHLMKGGVMGIYGPFRYRDNFTSDSNAAFDARLKARNSVSGIRDIEWIQSLAEARRMSLEHDYVMPANNQLLILRNQL